MTRRLTVLVTAPFDDSVSALLRDDHDVIVAEPRQDGLSLAERAAGDDDLRAVLARANVVVAELDRIDARTLALAPELALVVSCRAVPANVDLDACAAAGVEVATTPGRNAEVTADFAFALILDVVRHLSAAQRWLRSGAWSADDVFEPYRTFQGIGLRGRRLGVVGGGAVGRRVAQRALGFGMDVVVFDPGLAAGALGEQVTLLPLDEVLATSDIVTLHVPLTAATTGMIGKRELALLRDDASLVNAARAGLIDADALLDTLRSGRLASVGLDVFHTEPISADDELFSFDRVTLTPHIAGASEDVVSEHSRMAADTIRTWADRRPGTTTQP